MSSPMALSHVSADDSVPPPYSGVEDARLLPLSSSANESAQQVSDHEQPPFAEFSPFRPVGERHVNYICLFSRHNSISGTYYIDPAVPEVTPGLQRTSNIYCDALCAHRKNWKRAFGWNNASASETFRSGSSEANLQEINASFDTLHGAITLDIAVAGSASGASEPICKTEKMHAHVMASSRHGRINLNLFEIHPDRCLDLDVSTRHGAITVFLPPTFSGVMVFRTRRGRDGIVFLPELAKHVSIIRATDREVLAVLSSPNAQREPSATSHMQSQKTPGDGCVIIGTRHGKITVGISGVDHLNAMGALPGLFKKLGGLIEMKINTFVQAQVRALEAKLTGGEPQVQHGPMPDVSGTIAYASESKDIAKASSAIALRAETL
ncbi:hypothetical protein OBBRIDRAFT_807142 [Obba rivulosa]|uniref:DUF7330 domain-containing protein n=1 Tax=Obba rivulosa TaxID=1052685 RepID=A0A8E2DFF9_9APHY|nr:hypothetical protein OBBRIDRAFT_807142 [Obba rivulosa]